MRLHSIGAGLGRPSLIGRAGDEEADQDSAFGVAGLTRYTKKC